MKSLALTLFFTLAALRCAFPARAGTTGTISGSVTEFGSKSGIANVAVLAVSPSQSEASITDQSGHFVFISLAPDRYIITARKNGYDTVIQPNITVFADNPQTIAIALRRLTEITHVYSRTSTDLVRSGTTSDVYSVDAAVAHNAQALGGGGGLNNAYSAIASIPGAFVPQGQQGWYQAVYIRGADFNAVGYEYDGVPINRAFDNYASGTEANLGLQELQIYPGGGPASSSATGLAGFINQVIKTGTYPGFGTLDLQSGAPVFYHKLGVEAGGASPDRRFSYYIGLNGYNQDYRLVDQFNGGGAVFPYFAVPIMAPLLFGLAGGAAPICIDGQPPSTLPMAIASPSCYVFAPGNFGGVSSISDRESILNLHYALAHKHDDGRDDLQLLVGASALDTFYYDSQLDAGLSAIRNAFGGPLSWPDGVVFPPGTTFGEPVSKILFTRNPICAQCVTYLYPSSPISRSIDAPLPLNKRGGQANDTGVFKLQYQKNFGSSAYFRVFGYSLYSDFLVNDPTGAAAGNITFGISPDYELSTHTHGLELQFARQMNAENLIRATANYTTASTVRFDNSTFITGPSSRVTNLVDGAGNCYDVSGNLAACNDRANQGSFTNPAPYPAMAAALGANADWIVTGASAGFSESGRWNTVAPRFASFAVEDEFKPNDQLFLDLGLRYERFGYVLADTISPALDFWAKAAQREFCYDPQTLHPDVRFGPPFTTAPEAPCPIDPLSGVEEVHPDGTDGHLLLSDRSERSMVSNVLSPRIAFTYTLDADTVLRGSFGRYAQPTVSAFTQYGFKQPNWPRQLFPVFWAYGFTTPRHDVLPQISDSFDLSYEHRMRGTEISLKLTPFLRETHNQQQSIFLDPITGAVSGLNVGRQQSYGVEVAANIGDFSRDGFAATLSYTFTNATVRYDNFRGTSRNVIDIVNDQVRSFNRLTAAGGGFPCYQNTTTGNGSGETATQCAADIDAIANPYYTLSVQPLFDRNAEYYPFDIFPTIPGAPTDSFFSPHVFSGVFQYKRGRIAISPSFEFNAGTRYGAPLNIPGIDPTTCGQNSAAAGIAAPDPHQADYTSCGELAIPNPENRNRFDRFGEFQNPWQLSINAQMTYTVSPKVTATLVLANIVNRCFGGTLAAWSQAAPPGSHGLCSYGGNVVAPYVSNLYNGFGPNDAAANGGPLNPFIAHAYAGAGYAQPFQAFLQLQIELR